MVRRRGVALLQVLVLSLVLLIIATFVIRWQLQRYQLAANDLRGSQLKGDAEVLRNSINSCLVAAGYPAGSCTPNAAQSACVPAGAAVVFGGNPPSCSMRISVIR